MGKLIKKSLKINWLIFQQIHRMEPQEGKNQFPNAAILRQVSNQKWILLLDNPSKLIDRLSNNFSRIKKIAERLNQNQQSKAVILRQENTQKWILLLDNSST